MPLIIKKSKNKLVQFNPTEFFLSSYSRLFNSITTITYIYWIVAYNTHVYEQVQKSAE